MKSSKGQSRIDYPETLVKMGTQDTGQRQENTVHTNKMRSTDLTKTRVYPGSL